MAKRGTGIKISRLTFELCQRDGIDVLGRLCSNDALSLPYRLNVVDEAIRVNLISRDELDRRAPVQGSTDLAAPMSDTPASSLPWWRLFARGRAWREAAQAEKAAVEARRRAAAIEAARRVDARASDIRIYEACTGAEFERLVARAFRQQGYSVEEMGGANDGGVDLHVRKNGWHAIVQCKAHARPIGPAVTRELMGTLQHHAGATIAYLATTNGVTASAKEWCSDKPIRVIVPDDLIRGRLDHRQMRR